MLIDSVPGAMPLFCIHPKESYAKGFIEKSFALTCTRYQRPETIRGIGKSTLLIML